MKHSLSLDAPIARQSMERVLRPFNIWFMLVMAMLGSCLFIGGMIGGGLNWLKHTSVPDSTLMMLLGIGSFAFWFPYFVCLYYCRILFRAIQNLEQKVQNLDPDAENHI